jgi:hypothetical protein
MTLFIGLPFQTIRSFQQALKTLQNLQLAADLSYSVQRSPTKVIGANPTANLFLSVYLCSAYKSRSQGAIAQ